MKGNLLEIRKNVEAALRWMARGKDSLDKGDPDSTLMYLTVGSAEAKRAREQLLAELCEREQVKEEKVVVAPAGVFKGNLAVAGRMVAVAGFLLIGFTISHFADQAKISRMKERHLEEIRQVTQNLPDFSDPEFVTPGETVVIEADDSPTHSGGASPRDILTNTNDLLVELSATIAAFREREAGSARGERLVSEPGSRPVSVPFNRVRGGRTFENPFPIVEVEPVRFPLRSSGTSLGGERRAPLPNMGDFNHSG